MEDRTLRSQARPQARWKPLAPGDRLTMLSIPAGFVVVVLIGLWLSPDPRGVGTHEQLGLPPCTSQAILHIPCPFCGMTTSFSLMSHGQPAAAFRAQPAGALMFLLGIPVSIATALLGMAGVVPAAAHRLLSRPVWISGLIILALAWVYKIYQFTMS